MRRRSRTDRGDSYLRVLCVPSVDGDERPALDRDDRAGGSAVIRTRWWGAYLHTERGLRTVDRLGRRYRGPLRRLGTVGVYVLGVVMVATVAAVAFAAYRVVTTAPEPTAANDPANVLAVPGVNAFLPASDLALIAAAFVLSLALHELGHAVMARAEGVELEEVGLVLVAWVVPVGAYVLPSADLERAPTGAYLRVVSAGLLVNVALALAALAAFLLGVTGASLAATFRAYFAVLGFDPAVPVAELGTGTKLAWWVLFANANLAVTNALPVAGLDGGQYVSRLAADYAAGRRRPVVAGSSVAVVLVVLVVLFGPHLL